MSGLAAAGLVLQGAGLAKSWSDQKSARRSQKRIRRATLPMVDASYRESMRQSQIEEADVLGRQRVGFAAGNVVVGRGTARLFEEETREEFKRARMLAARSYQAERVATREGMSTAGPNYAAGLASLASSISQVYMQGQASESKERTDPYG